MKHTKIEEILLLIGILISEEHYKLFVKKAFAGEYDFVFLFRHNKIAYVNLQGI